MVEWNVYVNGRYIGTVHAKSEESARLAAWSTFDLSEGANVSVSRR